MQKTPLHAEHLRLGARMVDFGGWEMPVQYSGVIDEHMAVRQAAGLFDVSHMGEIDVRGEDALTFVQEVTINDAATLVDGQVQYSALCDPDGGTVDDITLYRFAADHYLFCVNAANSDKDFAWLEKARKGSFPALTLRNRSSEFAQLALQGPEAASIIAPLTSTDLTTLHYYHFIEGEVAGIPTIISRTGYTGEDGFELYLAPDQVVTLWCKLLECGSPKGLLPIGLGARDTLRLEMKYALYGHELSATISPLEAGLGWITKLGKTSFIGREALLQQKEAGLSRKLVALKMTESGIPRADYPIFCGDKEIGVVTSGTLSPSLRQGIALALVDPAYAALGTLCQIGIRSRKVGAEIVKPPFVTPKSSAPKSSI